MATTHGCVSYPCPICHASAIAAADAVIRKDLNEWILELMDLNHDIQELITCGHFEGSAALLKFLADLDFFTGNFAEHYGVRDDRPRLLQG